MSKKLLALLVGLLWILSISNTASAQSPDWNPNSPCPSGTGPGGITARLYEPTLLTQEQRQWLWVAFGGSPNEVAPVGYGGHACGGTSDDVRAQTFAQLCRQHEHERGPQGVRMGAYVPQDLTSSQRQWLWSNFYPNQSGNTPAIGWGGEFCPWQGGQYYANPNQNQDSGGQGSGGGNGTTGGGQSSGSNGLNWSQVRETTNGGIHVSIYCELTGHGSANITVTEGNSNSWRCSDETSVDFEYACQMAWGSNYHASISDISNIYAWRCSTGSSSGNSSTNNSGGFTAAPADSICGNLPAPNVSVGQRARVATYPPYANNVRSGAGTGYGLVTQIQPGEEFGVTGGPICANGFRWWQVNFNGTVGWTPDGDLNNRWIEPVGGSTNQQSQTTQLGRGCTYNNVGTVTCTAITVVDGGIRDPYIGIFELPRDGASSRISYVIFTGTGGTVLTGTGHCGAYAGTVFQPLDGFELVQGCVHGIERSAFNQGRDNPNNWTMTYRPN